MPGPRRSARAVAKAVSRPVPDLRWVALAAAALAGAYGVTAGVAPGAPPAAVSR